MDGAGRMFVEELIDRVLLATALMLAAGLVGALMMLPIDAALVLLGLGACGATVDAYRRPEGRGDFRLLGLGTCACLYGSFLLAAGQGGDQRLTLALGLSMAALGGLILRSLAARLS